MRILRHKHVKLLEPCQKLLVNNVGDQMIAHPMAVSCQHQKQRHPISRNAEMLLVDFQARGGSYQNVARYPCEIAIFLAGRTCNFNLCRSADQTNALLVSASCGRLSVVLLGLVR